MTVHSVWDHRPQEADGLSSEMEQEGNCGLEGQLHFLDSEVHSVHDFL